MDGTKMSTYEEALKQATLMAENCPSGCIVTIKNPSSWYYYADYITPRSMSKMSLDFKQTMLEKPERCPYNPGSRSIKHHNIVLALNKRSKR